MRQTLAAGMDFLRTIARGYQLDLNRVVVLGHSSGGSFAQWMGARPKLPRSSPLYKKNPLKVKAIPGRDAGSGQRAEGLEGRVAWVALGKPAPLKCAPPKA
jgi:acetyl esterase/lipase